jgi:hypothetical protein
MRLKIILSNTSETISAREDELTKILNGIRQGVPVMVSGGIFNPSFCVGVVEDTSKGRELAEARMMKQKTKESGPFSKFIAQKYAELPEKNRSQVDTDVARGERELG